ncbi:hypothetical protein CCUG20998_03050 [Mycobacterium marinum]|nr:hypothetical protein CCUG20998_03050 [Mycobacterium marinum]
MDIGERALPLTRGGWIFGLRIYTTILDPRRVRLDRARRGQHLALLVIAVAHHQAVAVSSSWSANRAA